MSGLERGRDDCNKMATQEQENHVIFVRGDYENLRFPECMRIRHESDAYQNHGEHRTNAAQTRHKTWEIKMGAGFCGDTKKHYLWAYTVFSNTTKP